MKYVKIVFVFISMYSCNNNVIDGTWSHDYTKFNFDVDSTFSEQSSDIELTQNDSIIFSASGEVHTTKKTFNGSWYIKDRNILILDVDWGQKTNEIKLGSGTWMLFKIITLDKEAMILESENSRGISTHYFSRIVKY